MRAGYGDLALFYRVGGTPFGLQALAPWEGKEVYVYLLQSLGSRPLFIGGLLCLVVHSMSL